MLENNKKYKIAVIGGGASGLIAAHTAARKQNNTKVIILEGNKKLGKKLLATGNGRCNLTNMDIDISNFHGDLSEAQSIIREFTPQRIIAEFARMGIACTCDREGRVYPANFQAAAVAELLRCSCEEKGVITALEFNVLSVAKTSKGFIIEAESGEKIESEKIILSAGGLASPKHSCGKGGYDIAKRLGHGITPVRPALTPLRTRSKLPRALKGMRCKAMASLYYGKEMVCKESGEVIFSDGSISGICIFGLSQYVLSPYGYTVKLDITQEYSREELREYIIGLMRRHPSRRSDILLSGIVNMKVGAEIVGLCQIDRAMPISLLNKNQMEKIVSNLKELRFEISGIGSWESAQITAGGIPLSEIDIKTMESRKVSGLYLAGEILNVNGNCGGYNLHWAWATGIIAGENAGI